MKLFGYGFCGVFFMGYRLSGLDFSIFLVGYVRVFFFFFFFFFKYFLFIGLVYFVLCFCFFFLGLKVHV